MEVKLFEVRDRATFIGVIAIRHRSRSEAERYLLAHAGYGMRHQDHERYVMLGRLDGSGRFTYDAYGHGEEGRTLKEAHVYITKNWATLQTGAVIDAEYITGEADTAKGPQRLDNCR